MNGRRPGSGIGGQRPAKRETHQDWSVPPDRTAPLSVAPGFPQPRRARSHSRRSEASLGNTLFRSKSTCSGRPHRRRAWAPSCLNCSWATARTIPS